MEYYYLLLLLAGLIGGFIAGMAGIGTGFLLIAIIPIALKSLGIPDEEIVKLTIANTIFATMCSSFVNAVTTIIKTRFYPKESLWTASAAIIIAALLLQFAVLQSTYSVKLYNSIIIIFLIYVIIRSLSRINFPTPENAQASIPKLITTGFAGGIVAAITGLGGGSVIMPLLNLWLKIDIKKAKGITYTIIFSIALILTGINILNEPQQQLNVPHLGYLVLPVALPLAIGVILSAPFGVILSHKFSPKKITYVFLSVITLVIIKKSVELLG